MSDKKSSAKSTAGKPKGIPVSKIPTSGRDSGTHSRSSSVSNLTTTSDVASEAGDATSMGTHGFKLDDRVWVNGTKPGHVKFLGKTEFAPGVWAGVLLDDPVGKNDGSVAGVKYFTCEPMRGVFARPQKLTRSLGPIAGTGDNMGSTTSLKNAGSTMGSTASLRSVGLATPVSTRGAAASVTSPTSATRGVCSKLRLGERVVVSSTTGIKSGILRFIGETDFAKGEWAGIELDEPVGKNDGSVAGKRYFSCPMKYGLFSPIHKISRAGGTTTPRSPSVRGTPLMRSTSRDSLNSSVSNCSKSSRVKLGVTSLTNSQARTPGMGIMTTTRALQESLKEKEQHIEQLLKEHDQERAEVARLTSRCEEIEAKYVVLLNQKQMFENNHKELEDQTSTDKRKLEDVQFQLEEETIMKNDLETQLKQKNETLKRLEEFLNKASDNKFVNIKEILEGKEVLSEAIDSKEGEAEQVLKKKIVELEENLTKLEEDKSKSAKELESIQLKAKEIEKKTEEELFTLNNFIQEKDDVITNLKNELNLQLEKLTNLFSDNQALSEQMAMQANAEKSHTEDVIKEFGEKINSLSEELNAKSSKLQELEISLQEKDSKISSLESDLNLQILKFKDVQVLNENLNQSFEQKETELTDKLTLQQTLEAEVTALKLQIETEIPVQEKKILDLVKQIEQLTSSLQEKEDLISQKLIEITNLEKTVQDLSASQAELKNLLHQAEENSSLSGKKSLEKFEILQKDIDMLIKEKEEIRSQFDLELQKRKSESEYISKELESSKRSLNENESEISSLKETVNKRESECVDYQKQINSLKETNSELNEAKERVLNDVNIKTEELLKLQTEQDCLLQDLTKQKNDLSDSKSEQTVLTEKLSQLEKNCRELNQELDVVKANNEKLSNEKEAAANIIKEKKESIDALEKQLFEVNKSIEEKTSQMDSYVKEIDSLANQVKLKEEEISQLVSRLSLAEQKVEMLNKDSSEHVMTLQKELSKVKEDGNKTKTALEQNILEIQNEKAKISNDLEYNKKVILEQENIISDLRSQIESKEMDLNSSFNQNEKLKQDVLTIENTKCSIQESLETQLLIAKEKYDEFLIKKEEELKEFQKEKEKFELALHEMKKFNDEKDTLLLSLQSDVQSKQMNISGLSTQIQDLNQKLDALVQEKADVEQALRKQLLATKENLSDELKQREQAVEKSLLKISEYEKIIADSKIELQTKEDNIHVLKKSVLEKESQFDELSKMIEASQAQLTQLNENNLSNVKLLESKEVFINEFKTEMEKKLNEREQNYKTEISNLQKVISGKGEIEKQKEEIISKLKVQNEQLEQQSKVLTTDLEKTKTQNLEVAQQFENTSVDLNNKIADLEGKYLKLMEEKDKIANEELKTRNDKKHLEEIRDSLIKEKVQQQEVVKDKEAKLDALQEEVNRMQKEFTLHKQDLEQKLNISLVEKEAASELKKHLDLQHSVLEELQADLQKSEDRCAKLESENQSLNSLKLEKAELTKKIAEFEDILKQKTQKLNNIETEKDAAEELYLNSQNILIGKEKECVSLKEQVQNFKKEIDSFDHLKYNLKTLEEENKILKLKSELNITSTASPSKKTATDGTNQMDSEERESLLSQIDFLNSIIVDMKQKNEELHNEIEGRNNSIDDSDLNLNEVRKIPPRLFCDICDMFDLHDTDDCPKQESFIDDEEIPNLMPQGVRKLEERPYCNTCEVFGHWTLDCKEEEEY